MADQQNQGQTQPAANQQGDETVTSPGGEGRQTQLQLDESQVQTFYASTSRLWGSAEEIVVDFSQGVRPTNQQNVARLKIDSRVIMSPWAAKRLAIALGQTIQRYEQNYGPLEIDPRRRQQQQQQQGASATTSTT